MSEDRQDNTHEKRLTGWQVALLEAVLFASGCALVATTVLAIAFKGRAAYYLYATGAAGLALLALSVRTSMAPRALSYIYVGILYATLLTAGHGAAWAPSVVAALCSLIVLAGLLLGPRVVVFLVAGTAGALVLGGAGVHHELYSPRIVPTVDPGRFVNWVRAGSILVLVTGAAAWALAFASRGLAEAEAQAAASLSALRTELALTQDARSKRVARETELRDAQKLQTAAQLGHGFAHLLNNVLTVVRSAVESARRHDGRFSAVATSSAILRATESCAEKTRDLLLLTRPHRGNDEPLVLHEALDEIGRKVHGRLRENVRCELDLRPVGRVDMPRSWLEQMAMNLLLNAEQAMPEGGRVRLATRVVRFTGGGESHAGALPPGSYAALSVTDTGPGISAEVALRACEPFFTTKGRDTHHGLGLTVAYGMARDLGGSLDIAGDATGTTTTIYFRLETTSPPSECGNTAPLDPLVDSRRPARRGDEDVGDPGADPDARRPATRALEWRTAALGRLLWTSTVAAWTGLFAAALMFQAPATYFALAWGIPLTVLLSLAAWRVGWPVSVRLGILLSSGLVFSAAMLLRFSFLHPAAVTILVLVILVTAVHAPRAIAPLLVGVLGLFVLAGWLYGTELLVAPLQVVSPERAANWIRFAVILVPLFSVVAFAALDVLHSARRRVLDMARAGAELEAGRKRRKAETQALARVEQMAQRSARMEAAGHLTGMVAHDLNNCLQTMINWAEMLRVAQTANDIERALGMIEQSGHYAEALVQKLQLGPADDFCGVSTDVGAALGGMRPMIQELLRRSNVELVLTGDKRCCVAVDELSLRRLVLNLAANARDAMVTGGTCRIQLRGEAGSVLLSVEDNGTGMDTATRQRLFEPFFTTKGSKGTGLGLHAVRQIVNATAGEISVRSELGRGSCFTVRWPCCSPPPQPEPRHRDPNHAASSARVLLAEDDPLVREALEVGLSRSGYRVTVAQDGDSAARLLTREGPFDILCTDAIMPGRPARELVSDFAKRFRGRPVVLISGYLPAATRGPAVASGNVSHLCKPFSVADLVRELERRLAQAEVQ